MKKDRNSFFQSANMAAQSYYPNQMMNPNVAPYQASQANQSFYAGPVPNNNMNNMSNMNTTDSLDNRLTKIERQIHKLDARITKLEGVNTNTTDIDAYDSSLYML